MTSSSLRIGIDVGGTNTDAVLLDGGSVIASKKVPTTENVSEGIRSALQSIESSRGDRQVDAVIIGTTHFMNAIVQARGLTKVACVRLATPPQTLPPFTDWPRRLIESVMGQAHVVAGGHQFNGSLLAPIDEAGLRAAASTIRDAGISHVVVSGVFSPVDDAAERTAEEIIREVMGDEVAVVRSHDVGQVGILERENAAILNASLLPLAKEIVDGFRELAASTGTDTPVYLSQNDGTLMGLDMAQEFPIFTVSSGPTNSMRGAALLSGELDAVVIDVGGTTTDVGLLQHGFPRDSVVSINLAEVRTNFRMPDVSSFGLGGGSLVYPDGTVGPESVGHRLTTEGLVFGGKTLTLTDVAVAAGLVELGDPTAVESIEKGLTESALDAVRNRLSAAVTAARLSADDIPTVVVGGGGFVVDRLPGLPEAVRPDHGEVANALGAALAQVSGNVDSVYSLAGTTREEVLERARALAKDRAVAAGALPATVKVVDEDDVPLTHLPGGVATRVRIKAIGDLDLGSSS